MKQHIDSAYLPFIVDHDPRCPPMGRVVRAEITALEDGEHAIEAEVEVFEPGDKLVFDEGRGTRIRQLPPGEIVLSIDRTFSQPEFQVPIAAMSTIFGTTPVYEVKKALEPIAVLGIGLGAVAVGKFAGAFFSKLGSNAADALSAHLKEAFRWSRPDQVRLLRVEFDFVNETRQCRAEIIVTSPSDADIDGLLREGLAQIDRLLPMYVTSNVTRYVFEYSSGKSVLKFAERSDGVPVFPASDDESEA